MHPTDLNTPLPEPQVLAAIPSDPQRDYLRQMELLLALVEHSDSAESQAVVNVSEPDRLLQRFRPWMSQAEELTAPADVSGTLQQDLRERLANAKFSDYRKRLRQRVLTALETNRLYLEQVNLWSRVLRRTSTEDPRAHRYDASGSLVAPR